MFEIDVRNFLNFGEIELGETKEAKCKSDKSIVIGLIRPALHGNISLIF